MNHQGKSILNQRSFYKEFQYGMVNFIWKKNVD